MKFCKGLVDKIDFATFSPALNGIGSQRVGNKPLAKSIS